MNIAPGEEVGTKVVRLLYVVGAGFVCTAAINKWRELEKKANISKQQQKGGQSSEKAASNSNAVQKAF